VIKITNKLTGLAAVGFIIAAATTSAALLNDTVVSEDNTFEAGSIVLNIGYETVYNNEQTDEQELTTNPGTIFDFDDIKPGDTGTTTVTTHVSANSGWKWILFNQTEGEGQLAENIELDIFYDLEGTGEFNGDDEYLYQGSLADVEDELGEGFLLDGDPATEETEPFTASEEYYLSFQWQISEEVQNIEGGLETFDLEFYAEQLRHNEDSENPWQ